jgi:single-strand selective monofunctional uracil DNA glycosylase
LLSQITDALVAGVEGLTFAPPVTHVYNPLIYARAPWDQYCQRYGQEAPRELLLVGMNPGPFGMAQVGVPFGEVSMVRDWLGIEAPVGRPPVEHPQRPVQGFACPRREVSGARLWGWARDTWTSPDAFFARAFVWSYCPLAFMEASGRNRTPDQLPRAERDPLFAACDLALARVLAHHAPRLVIGVGRFAQGRAAAVVKAAGITGVTVGLMPHPSPASPQANAGWAAQADAALAALGVDVRAGAASAQSSTRTT